MDSQVLTAALSYRERGFSIIPTTPGCKKAAVGWKRYQRQLAEETQLRQWFGVCPAHGIAVVLGSVSGGLVCRDFDTMPGYQQWEADHPCLAETLPTVATFRGRPTGTRVGVC